MQNFYELLATEYQDRTAPLREKQTELRKQLECISPSEQEREKHRTTLSVLDRRIQDAVFDDKPEIADQLRAETRELKKKLDDQSREADTIRQELKVLDGEITQIAGAVLRDTYPKIQQAVREQMQDTVDLLDSAWAGLQRFERETPIHLAYGVHFEGLRFPPIFATQNIRKRLERWL